MGPEGLRPGLPAKVYAFASASDLTARIPFATASVDESGVATFPTLGDGRYLFKLVNALSSRKPVPAEVLVGTVNRVRFPLGTIVRGRVRFVAPVQSAGAVVVRITPEIDMTQPARLQGDLSDLVNAVVVAPDGAFTMGITATGKYRLTAEWGTSRASRSLEVKREGDEIDLGMIDLSGGATLRGHIEGCGATHLSLASAPDPERASVGQYLRVPVAPDGSLYAEGLQPGRWLAMAVCDNALVGVTPPSFVITADAPVQITFVVTRDATP